MEKNPEVGICGTWQKHLVNGSSWIHRAATDDGRCRSHLLFWCDLCHSTLMLRKETFIENNLFYDPSYSAEDYELWSRAIRYTKIINIPQILGYYSEMIGITSSKLDILSKENGKIVANNLQFFFDINLDEEQKSLFSQWNYSLKDDDEKEKKLDEFEKILRMIWDKNKAMGKFDNDSLLESIATVWYKSKYSSNIGDRTFINPKRIDDVFDDRYLSSKIIKYRVFRRTNKNPFIRLK